MHDVDWRRHRLGHALVKRAGVNVALQSESILLGRLPIITEPAAIHFPCVIGFVPIGQDRFIATETFAIDTQITVLVQLDTVAGAKSNFLSASTDRKQEPLGILGAFGKDANDAIDGICAPQSSARSADDFDPVNIFQERILHVPEHAGKQRGIYDAAINHHQQLVRQCIVEAAGGNGPGARISLGHLEIRCQSQRFRDTRSARAPDIFTGNDLDG